ncbi:dynamin [Rubrobacter tropicus]|uniref:Dynamin n=1 Tax=Rubrobacter tropicus TaxID=2653851 RepID=A0A6G8Q876_9ACTN|nr:dynamin family protein [Rubrobacter tropicus]QIN82517.1 dynamin [Rubrobacter tropicus]
MRVLDARQEALVGRERALLGTLVDFLVGFGAPGEDVEIVRRSLSDLEELFLLVIVGEFNAGKSAFVNALLGAEVSREGVTPTTDRITLLRHADEPMERERRDGVLERGHPNEFLREVAIVDTPGTNAIIRHHEELSRGFVPRSDLVIFVTSADRPLTESERGYLELVRDWGKKVLMVVNKADLLGDDDKVGQVRSFVEDGLRSALGLSPPIFFVSSLLARKAKAATSAMESRALLQASGFGDLEAYVHDLLDEEGRVRLKLQSPLGPVEELARRYRGAVEERLNLLEEDFRTSENVESQLALYVEDTKRDFEARLSEIENIVLKMGERGDLWLEENIRLMNVRELFREEKVKRRFEREVVADTEKLIDERVDELVDWLVGRNHKQWRTVVDYLERRRRAEYDGEMIGEVRDDFEHDRGKILRSVGKTAQDVVGGYDRERESELLANSIQNAVARTAAIEAGALGIGAVVVALATTRFLDATGVIAAAIIAGYGLFVLPNRRRKARQDFREKTDALRRRLGEVVRRQFETELGRSVEKMREAIAPYTRFVRTEHARMSRAREDLTKIDAEVDAIKDEISAPGPRSGTDS